MKKDARIGFRHIIRTVDSCRYALKANEVIFHPVKQSEMFDGYMSSPRSWLAGIGHEKRANVVFVEDNRGVLCFAEIAQE